MSFTQSLWERKMGLRSPEPKKEPKTIARQSEKQKQKLKEEKPMRGEKWEWFAMVRKKLTGTCGCGCGQPSSKHDDVYFSFSCAHIFPKKDFKSIQFHPLNWVERNYHDGCHSNFDNRSMEHWPNMADWEEIKIKFRVLEPLLTEQEKTKKFYTQLKTLVENERADH